MATQAAAKAKRETWRDWSPPGRPEPDKLLTRAELLDAVAKAGAAISEDDLQNWQRKGIVPYGVRRWHNGAARMLYPEWMTRLLLALRTLQQDDLALKQIGPRLRVQARTGGFDPIVQHHTEDHATVSATEHAHVTGRPVRVSAKAYATAEARAVGHVVRPPTMPDDLRDRLVAWAREHEGAIGTPVDHIVVSLVDERGHPLAFRIDPH